MACGDFSFADVAWTPDGSFSFAGCCPLLVASEDPGPLVTPFIWIIADDGTTLVTGGPIPGPPPQGPTDGPPIVVPSPFSPPTFPDSPGVTIVPAPFNPPPISPDPEPITPTINPSPFDPPGPRDQGPDINPSPFDPPGPGGPDADTSNRNGLPVVKSE